MNQRVHFVRFNGIAICDFQNDCARLPELIVSTGSFKLVEIDSQPTFGYAEQDLSDLAVHAAEIDGTPPLAGGCIETRRCPSQGKAA